MPRSNRKYTATPGHYDQVENYHHNYLKYGIPVVEKRYFTTVLVFDEFAGRTDRHAANSQRDNGLRLINYIRPYANISRRACLFNRFVS